MANEKNRWIAVAPFELRRDASRGLWLPVAMSREVKENQSDVPAQKLALWQRLSYRGAVSDHKSIR
jgi:hypothetical protein